MSTSRRRSSAMFTSEDLRTLMEGRRNIRNVSVISHVGHGKSTLTASLVSVTGIIVHEVTEDVKLAVNHPDQDKNYAASLFFSMSGEALLRFPHKTDGSGFLFNLIDVPGHVDFSSEATAALRVCDGTLLLVDCMEGFRVQSETVIRQALGERIRPVLAINKIDRCFLEFNLDGEEAYQRFQRIISCANSIVATYEDVLLGDILFHPGNGNVAFSSGLHGWAFTLANFSYMYAPKMGLDETDMMDKLWGEHYFDHATRSWTDSKTTSPSCKRGFVQFCYEPIKQVVKACMVDDKGKLWRILRILGVTLKAEDKVLDGEALVNCVLRSWLPATRALLEMMVCNLPSPKRAQKYRVANLYKGPLDDMYGNAIRNCDSEGPLMVHICKMIPTSEKGRLVAYGRVFAGKVSRGMSVRIFGPDHVPGQKDFTTVCVGRIGIWLGAKQEHFEDVPSGNTVAIEGLDNFTSATVTNAHGVEAFPIRGMKISVPAVVRVAVRCKVAAEIPRVVQGLKCLAKSDAVVAWTIGESGEQILIAGAGEVHLENCLRVLQEEHISGVEIAVSGPVVCVCETVLERSGKTVVIKASPKGQNQLYLEALPLEGSVIKAIEVSSIDARDSRKERLRLLCEELGWDKALTEKVLCFGPEATGPNMVVDMCKGGGKHKRDMKNSIVAGFQGASKEGALCGEKLRGVCVEVCDAATCRGGEMEVMCNARRAMHALQLASNPRLVEPEYHFEVTTLWETVATVYDVLCLRVAEIDNEEDVPGGLCVIRGWVAVARSFGLSSELKTKTSGRALIHFDFSRWALMTSDPLEQGSSAAHLVAEIRRVKGMKALASEFED